MDMLYYHWLLNQMYNVDLFTTPVGNQRSTPAFYMFE